MSSVIMRQGLPDIPLRSDKIGWTFPGISGEGLVSLATKLVVRHGIKSRLKET